ncbi:Sigma-70 family RNA polymerase sigma factor [Sulfidibacter corallicola]|uniref:Sigma-70 family RNA polymerase sigma factor n=1 Tax=Sulfidibacter corallicola TaxID=2818388 RepID=A0A8A4TMA7_SULCO|nr:sigma-70 family RNA polymerase sigma factor [Sulfidibacter corallicola]QTD50334.1 sigma-70 family RNA polymerase sigma factor [Sulfidibacter corallicola]
MESLSLMLHRFFEGETEAGFAIFERFEGNVARYLRGRGEADQVGDLISSIRLAFLEKLPHLRDRRQVKEFLFQITRDELAKHWLRGRRYVALAAGGDEIGTESHDASLNVERLRVLRECLDAIENQTVRQVAVRRYRMGERQKEISAHMRITIDQVKKYTRKAEISITDCVQRRMGGGTEARR